MLKTISAALLAASVIAAPAFAAEAGKTATTAPVIKADQSQTKAATTAAKPDAGVKADAKADLKADLKPTDGKATDAKVDAKVDAKSKAMNANAAVTTGAHKTVRKDRHDHKQVTAKESQKAQPDVTKPAASDQRN